MLRIAKQPKNKTKTGIKTDGLYFIYHLPAVIKHNNQHINANLLAFALERYPAASLSAIHPQDD